MVGMELSTSCLLRFQRGCIDWNALGPYNSYYLKGVQVPMAKSYVDLGVTVDTTLKFHQHIRGIVGKAGALTSNLLKSTLQISHFYGFYIQNTH